MNSRSIEVIVDDRIAEIVLRRHPVNALDTATLQQLCEACHQISEDDQVAAVVVRSDSPQVFSAGADIGEMRDLHGQEVNDFAHLLRDSFEAVASLPQPVVAAVSGVALGGGCELALACDHRVASNQLRIGQPEIRLGVVPAAGGTQRLPRLVGPSVAKDLLLTGRSLDAQQALAVGLVDEVVESQQVISRARQWAAQFTHGPKFALQAIKQLVNLIDDVTLREGLAAETIAYIEAMLGPDRLIGMDHFLHKVGGAPVFG